MPHVEHYNNVMKQRIRIYKKKAANKRKKIAKCNKVGRQYCQSKKKMDKMFELHPVIIIRGIMYKYLCHAICRTVFRMRILQWESENEWNAQEVNWLRARCISC